MLLSVSRELRACEPDRPAENARESDSADSVSAGSFGEPFLCVWGTWSPATRCPPETIDFGGYLNRDLGPTRGLAASGADLHRALESAANVPLVSAPNRCRNKRHSAGLTERALRPAVAASSRSPH